MENRLDIMDEIIKKLNYQPSDLSLEELENPLAIIAEFFDNNALHEVRDKLWELYKGWVNNSYEFGEGQEYADMLSFYTHLINVVNASYIYNERQKNEN